MSPCPAVVHVVGWAEDWKIGLVHIQPGRPMQNGHVESFHGRLRDECLNACWFRTLGDYETISEPNLNREPPVMTGSEIGGRSAVYLKNILIAFYIFSATVCCRSSRMDWN